MSNINNPSAKYSVYLDSKKEKESSPDWRFKYHNLLQIITQKDNEIKKLKTKIQELQMGGVGGDVFYNMIEDTVQSKVNGLEKTINARHQDLLSEIRVMLQLYEVDTESDNLDIDGDNESENVEIAETSSQVQYMDETGRFQNCMDEDYDPDQEFQISQINSEPEDDEQFAKYRARGMV